jgi:hypothetical protein
MNPGFTFDPPRGGNRYGHYEAAPVPVAIVTSRDRLNGGVLYACENAGQREILLPPQAQFSVLPSAKADVRDVLCIVGASGSGKSWVARSFAEEYQKLWPTRRVYVLSALRSDKTLDSLPKLKRVNIDTLVEDPFERGEELEAFRNSLVIFDDCESLTGPHKQAVNELQDALLTMGRHKNVSIIVCNHLSTRGKETRQMLNEATKFIVFPAGMGYHQLRYLLTHHVGIDPKDLPDINKIHSRWVLLSRSLPRFLLGSHEARML